MSVNTTEETARLEYETHGRLAHQLYNVIHFFTTEAVTSNVIMRTACLMVSIVNNITKSARKLYHSELY